MAIDSLLNRATDVVTKNLHVHLNNCENSIEVLPSHVKDRILHKICVIAILRKKICFKEALRKLIHSKTRRVNLICIPADDEILKILEPCKHLQQVCITGCDEHLTTEGMCDFFKNKSDLCMVRIPNCPAVNSSVLKSILEHCPKVAGLDLTGCENVTDEALQFLGMMENITWLAISNTMITNLGIEYLVKGKSNTKIKELRISNCAKATCHILKTIAENCPNIEVLDFHCSQNQDTVLEIDVGQSSDIDNFKNLKQLTWTISW